MEPMAIILVSIIISWINVWLIYWWSDRTADAEHLVNR